MGIIHIFPFGSIRQHSSIVVWGAGYVGTQYYEQLVKTNYCESICFVDKNYDSMQTCVFRVENPSSIRCKKFDFIVIAQSKISIVSEISEELEKMEIDANKIIWDDQTIGNYESIGINEKRYEIISKQVNLIYERLSKQLSALNETDNKRVENIRKTIEHGTNSVIWKINNRTDDLFRMRQLLLSIESELTNSIYGLDAYTDKEIEYWKDICSLLHVSEVLGFGMERYGNELGDGGYVLINDLEDRDRRIAYSFGISDDVTWDKEMANHGYDIYMYDHTISDLPESCSKFHFNKKGLTGTINNEDDGLEDLASILLENGHQKYNHMILKMDIEGSEYEFLESVDRTVLQQFDQIAIEFHYLLEEKCRGKVLSALRKITSTHIPVHIHLNNYNILRYIDNAVFGNTMEVTFANRGTYDFVAGNNSSKADIRNCKDRIELKLDNWNGFLKDHLCEN